MTNLPEKMSSASIQVNTPDGTMYVHVLEDPITFKPLKIIVEIGKNGSSIRAWCAGVSALIDVILDLGGGIPEILLALNTNRTDRISHNPLGSVYSGPDGIVYALTTYLRTRYVEEKDRPFLNQSWLAK